MVGLFKIFSQMSTWHFSGVWINHIFLIFKTYRKINGNTKFYLEILLNPCLHITYYPPKLNCLIYVFAHPGQIAMPKICVTSR